MQALVGYRVGRGVEWKLCPKLTGYICKKIQKSRVQFKIVSILIITAGSIFIKESG